MNVHFSTFEFVHFQNVEYEKANVTEAEQE